MTTPSPPSATIRRILDHLKAAIKRRGLTYQDVGAALDLSAASVKRLLASGQLSLDKIERIAGLLGDDLATLLAAAAAPRVTDVSFTPEQEAALALHPEAMSYFFRLRDGATPAAIARATGISPSSTRAYLRFLEGLELIEVHAGDRVRVRMPNGRLLFTPGGPLNALLFPLRIANIKRQLDARGQPDVFRHPVAQGWLGRYQTHWMTRERYDELLGDLTAMLAKHDLRAVMDVGDESAREAVTLALFVDRYDMYEGVMPEIGEFEGR